MQHLAYFVHDLGDAAVARRVRMLHVGGLKVTVIGFHRHGAPPVSIDGAETFNLGRTADGRLLHRGWAVLRSFLLGRVVTAAESCDLVMARNLEMLLLASRARRGRRLVYECLDIHRLLLGKGALARGIQAIERRLFRQIDLVVTSSSRFIDDYFHARQLTAAPMLLVENKLLNLSCEPAMLRQTPPAPPWLIGWFGMLRCRRSLQMLIDMVGDAKGGLEVVLAGIPARRELGSLFEVAIGTPGIRFLGSYRPEDLPGLYAGVHFAWAIDYFEDGLNSVWLMPNRLYESLANGAVPIALAKVETGAWLARHAVGVVVDNAAEDVPALLAALTPDDFSQLQTEVANLPRSAVIMGPDACRELVAAISHDRVAAGAAS